MSIGTKLLMARHHIIFMVGLILAFGAILYLESFKVTPGNFSVNIDENIPKVSSRPLTDEELQWGEVAWRYFERNWNAKTGLVNSVDAYPAATLWDTASYLLGLISAYKLELIDEKTFDTRLSTALNSLKGIELFDDLLPNKSYNANTLRMVNYDNTPTQRGIGWSAIDIGRVMVPFTVLVWNFPKYTEQVNQVISAWSMESVIIDGTLFGALVDESDKTILLQEGRIGYEEYAAKSFSLAGYDVSKALLYSDFLIYEPIYGVKVPVDSRKPEQYNAHNYVVSESYILDLLEYGGDRTSKEFAHRVYMAQKKRYENTGVLTAVSEDNIDRAPYFVYNTVYSSGKAWNAITETGEDASEFRSLSTKAVFGWHMLYETDYTKQLVDAIKNNYDEEKGWYSGIYEKTGKPNKSLTANTNAIILEALHFKVFGSMLKIGARSKNTLAKG